MNKYLAAIRQGIEQARAERADPPPILKNRPLLLAAPGAPAPAMLAHQGTLQPAEMRLAPVTCARDGTPFLAVLEKRDRELFIVSYHRAPDGAVASDCGLLAGTYTLRRNPDLACPVCASKNAEWTCLCAARRGSIHCGGSSDGTPSGLRQCACGRPGETRIIKQVKSMVIRGASLGLASTI